MVGSNYGTEKKAQGAHCAHAQLVALTMAHPHTDHNFGGCLLTSEALSCLQVENIPYNIIFSNCKVQTLTVRKRAEHCALGLVRFRHPPGPCPPLPPPRKKPPSIFSKDRKMKNYPKRPPRSFKNTYLMTQACCIILIRVHCNTIM